MSIAIIPPKRVFDEAFFHPCVVLERKIQLRNDYHARAPSYLISLPPAIRRRVAIISGPYLCCLQTLGHYRRNLFFIICSVSSRWSCIYVLDVAGIQTDRQASKHTNALVVRPLVHPSFVESARASSTSFFSLSSNLLHDAKPLPPPAPHERVVFVSVIVAVGRGAGTVPRRTQVGQVDMLN